MSQSTNQPPYPNYGQCLRCGLPLQLIDIESFRVGGTSGGLKLFFGELAELGEGMIEFEVFGCPGCRKVELRVPVPVKR